MASEVGLGDCMVGLRSGTSRAYLGKQMNVGERARFFEVADMLREEFQAEKPVRVRLVDYKNHFGGTADRGRYFEIRICRTMPEADAIEWLCHELAHCLEWRDYPDHGPAWTHAYGEIYRHWHDETEED